MPRCRGFATKAHLKLKKQVLVITNYRPDQQQSMLRFGDLLTSNKNNPKTLILRKLIQPPFSGKFAPSENCVNGQPI